jgi:hypothetical protein
MLRAEKTKPHKENACDPFVIHSCEPLLTLSKIQYNMFLFTWL